MKKILLVLITMTLVISCGKDKKNMPKKGIAKEVRVEELKLKKVKELKEYNGTIEPENEVTVVTPTGGYVKDIYMKNGEKVDIGNIILTLTDVDVESAYLEAEGTLIKAKSNYSKAKITFNKYQKLFDKQYISEDTYLEGKTKLDETLGDVKIAEAKFEKAKDDYDRLKIKAPISGNITDISAKVGEKISANESILTVVKNSVMELKIAVDAKDIKNIEVGKEANVFVPELNKTYIGKVSEINLSADSQTKKYDVKLLIDNTNGELIKGVYGKVTMEQKEVEGYFVPKKAVMIKDLYSYIAIERAGKAYILKVDQGISRGDLQEIKTNKIEKNDKVIVEGQYLVNNNDSVKEI